MKTSLPLRALALLVGCAPIDEDQDGFTADVDCDDNDNLVFPGGNEICDGIDNDCNGTIDDEYASGGGLVFYIDADGVGGDYVEVEHDPAVVSRLLTVMGQYRYGKATWVPPHTQRQTLQTLD